MFVRTIRNAKGRTYLMIVESYWENGKTRQRVLFNMGRLDLLQATGQIDNITRSLERFCLKTRLVDLSKDISVEESFVFGSVHCLKALFQRTSLQEIVEEVVSSHPQLEIPLPETVFAMIVSRFVAAQGGDTEEAPLSRFSTLPVCGPKAGTGLLRHDDTSFRERPGGFGRLAPVRIQQGETERLYAGNPGPLA